MALDNYIGISNVPISPAVQIATSNPGLDIGVNPERAATFADYLSRQQPMAIRQTFRQDAAERAQLEDMLAQAQIRRNTRALLGPDVNQFQIGLVERYQQATGLMPPMKADGSGIDFVELNSKLANLSSQEFKTRQLEVLSKITQGLRGSAEKTGIDTPLAQRALFEQGVTPGQGWTESDYASALVSNPKAYSAYIDLLKPQMTPADILKAQQTAAGVSLASDEAIARIADIRQQLAADPAIVGPLTGNSGARGLTYVAAALGASGAEKRYQSQQELLKFVNQQILTSAEKMKGNLSNKDIQFLQQSQLSLADTKATWEKFLLNMEKAAQRAKANAVLPDAQKNLSDIFTPADATPSATPSGASVSPSGASVSPSGADALRFTDDELRGIREKSATSGMPVISKGGIKYELSPAEFARFRALLTAPAAAPAATPPQPPNGGMPAGGGLGGAPILPLTPGQTSGLQSIIPTPQPVPVRTF